MASAEHNPEIDLLIHQAFPELAAALREKKGWIQERWEDHIRRSLAIGEGLTLEELRDHMEMLVAHLADALESGDPAVTSRLLKVPAEHAATRFEQQYNVEELFIEFRLLRPIIVEAVEASLNRRLTAVEDLSLDQGIDATLQLSIVTFVKHQTERLQAATAAEAKFLSFMSHDLRNNLNSVTLVLQVLSRRLRGLPEFAEDVEEIDAVQQTILETTAGMERLLQFERLRRAPDLKVAAVDLHQVASEVVRRFADAAGKKGVGLAVEVPPGATLLSDREWLAIALQNLVSNGVKYSSAGTVRVNGRQSGEGGWVVSVSDQGPGIPPEQVNTLFEAFRRGTTHGQTGTGLGLAIASQAARLLGGELRVESQVGVGSRFDLVLPKR